MYLSTVARRFWAFDDSNKNLPKNHQFQNSCQEFADLWQVRTGRTGGRTDERTSICLASPTQKAPSGQIKLVYRVGPFKDKPIFPNISKIHIKSTKMVTKKISPEMKRSRPTESQKIIEQSLKTLERLEIFIFVVFRISK